MHCVVVLIICHPIQSQHAAVYILSFFQLTMSKYNFSTTIGPNDLGLEAFERALGLLFD